MIFGRLRIFLQQKTYGYGFVVVRCERFVSGLAFSQVSSTLENSSLAVDKIIFADVIELRICVLLMLSKKLEAGGGALMNDRRKIINQVASKGLILQYYIISTSICRRFRDYDLLDLVLFVSSF